MSYNFDLNLISEISNSSVLKYRMIDIHTMHLCCKERKGERTICNVKDGCKEQSNNRDGGVKYGYIDRQGCKLN